MKFKLVDLRFRRFNRTSCLVFLVILSNFLFISNWIPLVAGEYVSEDEPVCREDCLKLDENLQDDCLNQFVEFYSYKLIKSIFNYGKAAIYAGLWASRYESPDLDLFENVFNTTLAQYNNSEILGFLTFDDLNTTATYIFDKLKYYSLKKDKSDQVPYASIPSLQCPILCTYEITTWQTLFVISLIVFVLAAITISLYTIFLRKQYVSLKNRLKNVRYIKVPDNPNN